MNSFFKKYKWEFIFWLIQLFYWGYISLKGYSHTYYVEGYTFGSWHKANTLVDFLTTLLLIGVVRYYLKNHLSWKRFAFKDFLKIIGVIFISGFIWTPLHIATGKCVEFLFFSGSIYPEELKGNSNRLLQTITMSVEMATCVISYVCVKVYINYDSQRLKTAQLKSSLRQAQLSNLKNQISPHFLFNNLNNIRGLMLEDQPKSIEMLTKLSKVLNHALYKNQFDIVSIREELKMVEYYISIIKMQMESRLQYSQNIDQNILYHKIPPMIIQLLVENAVKHGVSNKKKGGFIDLQVQYINKKIQIKVTNTGKLKGKRKNNDSTGVGIKNIIQRLKFIYDDQATFILKQNKETVVAEMLVPVIN